MTFPQFSRKNPSIWIDKCQDYFKIFDIPKGMWATYASMSMDDNAAKWLQMYKKKYGLVDWETFCLVVEIKFGTNDYREALTQLLELQQTESLEAYITQFEDLQYQVTMHNTKFEDLFFVTQFIKGLRLEIGSVVQAQVPYSMERDILLARIQQQVLERSRSKWQKNAGSSKSLLQFAKGDGKGPTQPVNLWRGRQTRDYRRANGLCYFCVEPFDANHKNVCSKTPPQPAQANALVLNDLDAILTEDVLNQLALEDTLATDFYQLSLNAISGSEVGEVLKVKALVRNKVMLISIDSGSSHSFVSKTFLSTMGITALPTTPKQVKLANGQMLLTDHWVPDLEWWTNGYTLKSDMRILPLGTYDAILGYDWLKAHSPMTCH
jgi:hypothetical protein